MTLYFLKKIFPKVNETTQNTNGQHMPLFDNECEDFRKQFYNQLNNYRRDKTDENQTIYIN